MKSKRNKKNANRALFLMVVGWLFTAGFGFAVIACYVIVMGLPV